MHLKTIVSGVIFSSFVLSASAIAQEEFQGSKHWISKAPNDEVRYQRMETYLRGFDQPMWEVGERFEKMEQALIDENYKFASYQWKKIKKNIVNGLMKRPARRANAEAIFLNNTWQSVYGLINSGDLEKMKQGFTLAKDSCMACHAAEKVNFVNDQPMFYKNRLNGG